MKDALFYSEVERAVLNMNVLRTVRQTLLQLVTCT